SHPPKKRRRVHLQTPSPSSEPSDLSASDLSSGTDGNFDDEDDEDGIVGLITKPAGEAGRPGRGGYNLRDALGWTATDFNQLKTKVDRLINKHLNTKISFAKQKKTGITTVVERAVEGTPILAKYADHWPLIDLLKLRLKYLSSKGKTGRRAKKMSK
ncbi:hypothetical protein BDY19DRAFT_998732, partial [Irpex rosettiformis]